MTALTLFPEQASTEAVAHRPIYFGLIGFSAIVTSIVVGCLIVFAMRYRRGSAAQRGNLPRMDRARFRDRLDFCDVLSFCLRRFLDGRDATCRAHAAPRRYGNPCRRQAMDVEDAAPERRSRDQRAPRPGRRTHSPRDDVRGRHPFVFRARVSHQAGRAAGALHPRLVQRHQDRDLSPVVHAALRHRTRPHDRRDRRHAAPGFRPLARGAAACGRPRRRRAGAVRVARLFGLSRRRGQGAGAEARFALRPDGRSRGRRPRRPGRRLHTRNRLTTQRPCRPRLRCNHAELRRA